MGQNNIVPAIDRVLTIFEVLSQSRKGLSISEVSRTITAPKSSTHRILTTLEQRGYLQKNTITGKYRFGLRLISLSKDALESLELREEARPFLTLLMRKTGLTVHMSVLEVSEAVIIEKIEAHGLFRVATWVGKRMDVHCTATGKALLWSMDDEQLDKLIKSRSFAKHNHKTIVSLSKLKHELARCRQLGYSVSDEENELGFRCVGAPIFDCHQAVVASVSVTGISPHITMTRIPSLGKLVQQTALDISTQLGYAGQSS